MIMMKKKRKGGRGMERMENGYSHFVYREVSPNRRQTHTRTRELREMTRESGKTEGRS